MISKDNVLKKVSILTVTFNLVKKGRKTFFYEMFRSVHEQTYKNIEHIIIDGGSNDGSLEFIIEIIEKYNKKNTIIISEPDNGINDATNKAFCRATGDYVILLCDDDYYTRKDSIELLVNTLENENADYVSGDCWYHDVGVWGTCTRVFAVKHPFLINTLLAKKECFFYIHGYFDNRYEMVSDFELMFRLCKSNLKGAECHKVVTSLRPGGYSMSDNYHHMSDTLKIFDEFYNKDKVIFSHIELAKLYFGVPSLITLLKIKWFLKDKSIRDSVFENFSIGKRFKQYKKNCEYYIGLKFITRHFKMKKWMPRKSIEKDIYSISDARKWIDGFLNK